MSYFDDKLVACVLNLIFGSQQILLKYTLWIIHESTENNVSFFIGFARSILPFTCVMLSKDVSYYYFSSSAFIFCSLKKKKEEKICNFILNRCAKQNLSTTLYFDTIFVILSFIFNSFENTCQFLLCQLLQIDMK